MLEMCGETSSFNLLVMTLGPSTHPIIFKETNARGDDKEVLYLLKTTYPKSLTVTAAIVVLKFLHNSYRVSFCVQAWMEDRIDGGNQEL
jgi:hypothetical protein